MKHILIKLIKFYQSMPGEFHKCCRHLPTCSNYSIEAINKYGSLKGTYLSIKRILKCNPWGTFGYDPVPTKGSKMKKIKMGVLLIVCPLLLSGCFFKRDTMENIDIYTTLYPINYLLDYLYGDNSNIYSIYPNGVNVDEFELSDKKIEEYSKCDLFVFNSLDKDRDYAVKMVNKNKNIRIIDVSLGMGYTYSIEELWLNAYNYLMMAQNVKDGLYEYVTNPYLLEEIDQNYEDLKYDLSKLDALLKETVNNANYKTIITDNNSLKLLEKYGLDVISLEETEDLNQTTINEVKKLITTNQIKYVYSFNTTSNETINTLINDYGITLLTINSMKSIDGGITNSNENYLTIMNNNIELLNKELYKE